MSMQHVILTKIKRYITDRGYNAVPDLSYSNAGSIHVVHPTTTQVVCRVTFSFQPGYATLSLHTGNHEDQTFHYVDYKKPNEVPNMLARVHAWVLGFSPPVHPDFLSPHEILIKVRDLYRATDEETTDKPLSGADVVEALGSLILPINIILGEKEATS